MDYKINLIKNGAIKEIKAEEGSNLLKILNKNGENLSAPCGGKGTCGKCKVGVEGITSAARGRESKLLSDKDINSGKRLACYINVDSDLTVYLNDENTSAKVVTEGSRKKIKVHTNIFKKCVKLEKGSLENQTSDFEKLIEILPSKVLKSKALLTSFSAFKDKEFTVVYGDEGILNIEEGNTEKYKYGVAVDIGSTTVAAYLMDLNTGEQLKVYSCLNPQKVYGADVISRINYTMEHVDGLTDMNKSIIDCINEIILYFENECNIQRQFVYKIVLAGNTTMMHFLMGLDSRSIAVAPFIPLTTAEHDFNAKELGININSFGSAIIMPGISSYVGADTVAAILSSELYKEKGTSLLVDIGTNGEIALGGQKGIHSCSVAAGPAFEGAQIKNGIGGVKGAIDKVTLKEGVSFTTIGNSNPIGICGSGIIDAVAQMLKEGLIDETGRIVDSDELCEEVSKKIGNRIIEVDNSKAFLLYKGDEKGGNDIIITQRDIREIQNAKAAIAAGIKVLASEAQIDLRDIKNVYLAGGFGSYINIDSAIYIGLLPKELKGKIKSIGNAAGMGAINLLLSNKMDKKLDRIKEKTRYVELSSKESFVNEYVNCMMLELS